MKRELLGFALAGSLVAGLAACGESAQTKHEKAVAKAASDAKTRVEQAQADYSNEYLPYVKKLGLHCVNALNDASQQDDADYDRGSNTFSKETAAALIAGDCPASLTRNDRISLYKDYHYGVGEPLRDLIAEGALKDGNLSPTDITVYQKQLDAAYLAGNIAFNGYGEYIATN